MFDISMEKEPALSLLYALIAAAMGLLCVSHYFFGHFDVLLIQLMSIAIFIFTSVFLFSIIFLSLY